MVASETIQAKVWHTLNSLPLILFVDNLILSLRLLNHNVYVFSIYGTSDQLSTDDIDAELENMEIWFLLYLSFYYEHHHC